MDKILVAGVKTVVGANLAEALSTQHSVVGVSFNSKVSLPSCETEPDTPRKPAAVLEMLQRVQPSRIVLCGSGAESSWDESQRPQSADVAQSKVWIDAAHEMGCRLTLISSDAIFTGPWMFHAENSHSICPSTEAGLLMQIEQHAAATSADTLIVRTHAIGWQSGSQAGWLETLLSELERGMIGSVDFARHGTPIAGSLADRTTGFGCGETSLQTRKIRRALGIPLPLLDESLDRLYQQHLNGYRARLSGQVATSRVA